MRVRIRARVRASDSVGVRAGARGRLEAEEERREGRVGPDPLELHAAHPLGRVDETHLRLGVITREHSGDS